MANGYLSRLHSEEGRLSKPFIDAAILLRTLRRTRSAHACKLYRNFLRGAGGVRSLNLGLTLLPDYSPSRPASVGRQPDFQTAFLIRARLCAFRTEHFIMSRQPLVLLVPADRVAGMTSASSLASYGYDVLLAHSADEASHLLRTNRRISVLVIDTDRGQVGAGLALARDARVSDPGLKVIYTSQTPSRLRDAEKVSGAPCLCTPYRPHQLASVISQLVRRYVTEAAEAYAA